MTVGPASLRERVGTPARVVKRHKTKPNPGQRRLRQASNPRAGQTVRTSVHEVVFGLGYVGLTNLCCRAHSNHRVLGIDVDQKKIAVLKSGESPLFEPGLAARLKDGVKIGCIQTSSTVGDALNTVDYATVCVGTPSMPNGALDMRQVLDVTRQIAHAVGTERNNRLTVIYRSTLQPGTMQGVITPLFQRALGADFARWVELIYYPEFLREGHAIADYHNPARLVVGTVDGQTSQSMNGYHADSQTPIFTTTFAQAEATKLFDNSWHALKVAFGNEMGRVCQGLGLSATKALEIFTADTKLNVSAHYLQPGGAFGGSCLPKDLSALRSLAHNYGVSTPVLDALTPSNQAHKAQLFDIATDGLEPGAKLLLAGLAFKADSDDLRHSPNAELADQLQSAGFRLSVYDPTLATGRVVHSSYRDLLVSQPVAESGIFARVIVANATGRRLHLGPNQDRIYLDRLE